LKDGHDTIEKLRGELNAKIKESVEINQKLMDSQAKLIMEQKTRDLPENKKQFVTRLLEGKKPEEIEKNFKFVLEMYDRDETEKIETEKEKATKTSQVVTKKVDAPKAVIVEQKTEKTNTEAEGVQSYLEGLKNNS
jgi:hypothetical protein